MQKINPDAPAMPVKAPNGQYFMMNDSQDANFFQQCPTVGLSIRAELAARFMAALLSDVNVSRWLQEDTRYDGKNFKGVVAMNAIEFADALIAELNREG